MVARNHFFIYYLFISFQTFYFITPAPFHILESMCDNGVYFCFDVIMVLTQSIVLMRFFSDKANKIFIIFYNQN